MGILQHIDAFLVKIALFLITIYQKTLSPDTGLPRFRLKGRICTHEPHCSAYAKECFKRYGFLLGFHYTIERVTTCLPHHEKQYDPSVYSVVFFSGAPIGIPFLEALLADKRFDVTGVVTMPDAPSGRGMHIQENSIKQKAKEHNIDVQTPSSLRTTSVKFGEEAIAFHTWLEEKQPDFIVVVAYGKIIPLSLLSLPRIGPINVHGSLLPKYRGASPLQSVFLHGEKETGITIMRMSEGLDEGAVIHKKTVALPFGMTVVDLLKIFGEVGPTFLNDTLWDYGKGIVQAVPQDHTQASFTSKISKEDAEIDIYATSLDIVYAKYKAYALRPKVYFMYKKKRCIIESLTLDPSVYADISHLPLLQHKDDLTSLHPAVIACTVKPEGKKSLIRDDFVRGYAKS